MEQVDVTVNGKSYKVPKEVAEQIKRDQAELKTLKDEQQRQRQQGGNGGGGQQPQNREAKIDDLRTEADRDRSR